MGLRSIAYFLVEMRWAEAVTLILRTTENYGKLIKELAGGDLRSTIHVFRVYTSIYTGDSDIGANSKAENVVAFEYLQHP